MASTYLTRTTGTSTLNTKCTFSGWYKRSILGTYQHIFSVGDTSGAQLRGRFRDTDTFQLYANITGQGEIQYITNRVFRDVNSWYHILISIDCTQSAANRVKIYVNGIEETSFDGTTQAEITSITLLNSQPFQIGRRAQTADTYFDGSISHFHFIDGTAYDASAFGETDTTTGEWKAKTSPSVTYGTNGFFILKDGNGITDQSGEGNDFTLGGGTLTNLKDNPDNTFATLNPLDKGLTSTSFNLSNGNLTMGNAANTNDYGLRGTLGASSGKYYWEIKAVNGGEVLGITKSDTTLTINNMSGSPDAGFWGWQSNGTGASINSYNNGTFSNSNALQGYANNSIIGVALDMDNGKLYMSIDGVWKDADNNTSDPANQTNPFYTTIPTDGTFIMPYTEHRSSGDPASHWNFGNGYFGTTAVSSAGTNASDNGIFEYDVPTGYTALSTKGLNL